RRARRRVVLLGRGHDEFCALGNAVGPALHDALLTGVEAHAFFAVGVAIAKEAGLPAAEAMPGHGHGNRHVHADHADLDAATEFTGDAAVAREQADTVGVLMLVDELDRVGERSDAHA